MRWILHTVTDAAELPEGEFVVVELPGHQTLVGRISEVERFGTKMLCIEPLYQSWLLDPIWQGGTSIYRVTPCSAAAAWKQRPKNPWTLPDAVRNALPPSLLPPPDIEHGEPALPLDHDDDDDIQPASPRRPSPRDDGDDDEEDIVF